MNSLILAADFGGTTIKLGLVRDGGVIAGTRLDACAERPMAERLEAVACAWEGLLTKAGCGVQACIGAALALPFLADPKRFRVLGEFGKYPGAVDIDFNEWSRARLGLPIAMENDLRVALLGEWAMGAAQGRNDVVMLALGTGIGCAVLAGGRLFRGANNRAGTLVGHGTVALDRPSGRCGNIGCAEDIASTATLGSVARGRRDFAGSALAAAEKIDFETLFNLASRGDDCSRLLLGDCLTVWAVVVQNAVLAYDPEVVVLGGGVLRSRDLILPAIEQHLRRHMPGLPLQTPVVAAELGDDAALIGGRALFKQTHPTLFQ